MLLDLALLYSSNRFVAVGYVGETTTNTKFGEKFVHRIFLSKRMKYTFCDFIFFFAFFRSRVQVHSVSTLWDKNHPFYFLNNFGKSRSILIILAHRDIRMNEIATKQWQNPPFPMSVITLPCETQHVSNCS